MELPESFAAVCCQVLRERRLKLGLSQEELARRSGLARSYICDVERGARHPALRNVAILSSALEISTSELISDVELSLASRVDVAKLKDAQIEAGLQTEIVDYLNNCFNDGVVIADNDGFILFNQAAEQLVGMGRSDTKPSEWAQVYGVYKDDGVTPYTSDDLPIARAIQGESLDQIKVVVRNESLPEGRSFTVRARPITDGNGQTTAGMVMFRPSGGNNGNK
jgi:two-component system, sensor histidine kinase and response regulator